MDSEQQKPLPPDGKDIDQSRLIKVGGPIDRLKVSLRVFGDFLVPADVTRLLGCEPTHAQCKGDVIPDRRYHRVARTGSWCLHGSLPEKTDLEEQVTDLLSKVTNELATWNSLVKEFNVDIFCGVFLDDWNRGFGLSPQVLKLLSDRGIAIGFDIYSYGGEEEEETS